MIERRFVSKGTVYSGHFSFMFRYSILIFEMGAESIPVGRRPVQNINEVDFSYSKKHKVHVYVIFGYSDIIFQVLAERPAAPRRRF